MLYLVYHNASDKWQTLPYYLHFFLFYLGKKRNILRPFNRWKEIIKATFPSQSMDFPVSRTKWSTRHSFPHYYIGSWVFTTTEGWLQWKQTASFSINTVPDCENPINPWHQLPPAITTIETSLLLTSSFHFGNEKQQQSIAVLKKWNLYIALSMKPDGRYSKSLNNQQHTPRVRME